MVEARVFAVTSGKGGAGKTTTAVALGACAAAADRTAVVVDADLGMGNVATFLDVAEGEGTIHDVLAGDADVADAVRQAPGGFDVVPASSSLDGYAAADPSALGDVIDALREAYDTVIVDAGAGLSHDTVMPLGVADDVLVVVTPDRAAVENAATVRELADTLDVDVRGAVVSRSAGDASGIRDALGVPLLGTVPRDDTVQRAVAAGEAVPTFDPSSPAGSAYAEVGASLFDVAVTTMTFGPDDAAGTAGDPGDIDPAAVPFSDAGDGATAGDETGGSAADDADGDAPTDDGTDGAVTDERGDDADADGDEAREEDRPGDSGSFLNRLSGGLIGGKDP